MPLKIAFSENGKTWKTCLTFAQFYFCTLNKNCLNINCFRPFPLGKNLKTCLRRAEFLLMRHGEEPVQHRGCSRWGVPVLLLWLFTERMLDKFSRFSYLRKRPKNFGGGHVCGFLVVFSNYLALSASIALFFVPKDPLGPDFGPKQNFKNNLKTGLRRARTPLSSG